MMLSYNVYGLKVGPEGMPVIVGIWSQCTQVLKHRAKVDKAGGSGWYVAKSGSRSGRRYMCWYALMVMSKGLIVQWVTKLPQCLHSC